MARLPQITRDPPQLLFSFHLVLGLGVYGSTPLSAPTLGRGSASWKACLTPQGSP